MDPTDTPARLSWYWWLPAAFVVHDSEEWLTLPSWIAAHRDRLAILLQLVPASERWLALMPTTHLRAACAIAVLLAFFLVVTRGAMRAQGRGAWQVAFCVLLGGFFLHGFTHLAQAIYFRGYTPGVFTAAVVVIPASLWMYRRLYRQRLLRPAAAAAQALLGLLLLIAAVLLALAAGAALTAG
jgi:hypothetical protein